MPLIDRLEDQKRGERYANNKCRAQGCRRPVEGEAVLCAECLRLLTDRIRNRMMGATR